MLLLLHCSSLPVQVDLGGRLGEGSWLRPLADALGWVDAYVERMLMAVILVKDEVSVGVGGCLVVCIAGCGCGWVFGGA